MVSLFNSCWYEIKNGQISEELQNKHEGTLYYKNDFDGVFENLPNGFDTKVKDIP